MEFVARLQDEVTGGASSASASLRTLRSAAAQAGAALQDIGGRATMQASAAAASSYGAAVGFAANAWTRLRGAAVSAQLDKESAKLGQLKARLDQIGKGGSADIGAGRKLQAEIAASEQKVGQLSSRLSRAGIAGKKFGNDASAGMQAASAGAGLARTAILTMGAAAGVASVGGLAKMALGYAGLAKMQAITYRLGLNFRSLFRGIDSGPAIRAYDKFEKSIFNRGSVAGQALSGLFTRSFNAFFSLLEKAQPYATAFAQGIVLAFLYAENAVLRARIALLPYIGSMDTAAMHSRLLKAAAIGGGLAIAIATGYAVAAAAPFLVLAGAITAVVAAFDQWDKIKKEWDGDVFMRQIKSDLGLLSDEERMKQQGLDEQKVVPVRKSDEKAAAAWLAKNDPDVARANANGAAVGAAMGKGVVNGMKSAEAEVQAGGVRLAGAADKGVRAGAKIQSPSRLMRERGGQMGDGAALGLADSAPRVQKAADQALVPDVKPGASGAQPVPAGLPPLTIHVDARGATDPGAVDAAARRAVRAALIQMGAQK